MIAPYNAMEGVQNRTGAAEALPVEKTERPEKAAERPEKAAERPVLQKRAPNVNEDRVSISENGSIDLSLFNYIDKGGDAQKALTEGESEKGTFAPKPNFFGMSVNRYSRMKSEIEQLYANDPDSKNKYLQELNKALDDYIMLQTKIADQLTSGGRSDSKEGVSPEKKKEELAKLKELFQVGSEEVTAIISKVLGDAESSAPEEVDKAVDELFIDAYRQRTGSPKRTDAFGNEIDAERTKQIWESIRLHIDSEE